MNQVGADLQTLKQWRNVIPSKRSKRGAPAAKKQRSLDFALCFRSSSLKREELPDTITIAQLHENRQINTDLIHHQACA
jgi:hypothetical protein